jgi:hypothetical protein
MIWANSVLPTYIGASGQTKAGSLGGRPIPVQVGDTHELP